MAIPKFWTKLRNVKTNSVMIGSNTLDEETLGKIVGDGTPIQFIGTINATANPNYPAANKGHKWLFSHAGKIGGASGIEVEAGDQLVCTTTSVAGTHAAVGANYTVVQGNIVDGVTSAEASTDNAIARYSGITGQLIQNSGITIDDDDNIAGIASIGATGDRVTKLWATDVEVTNAMAGSITGNAATATTAPTDAILVDQTTPQTLGVTGSRLAKLWATDIECTNDIVGSITGNAATATSATSATSAGSATVATNLDGGNATTLLGSVPYQSAEDTTTLLAPNTTTTKKYIAQTGDGANGAAPAWSQVANSEISWGLTNTYLPVMGASALADSTTTYNAGVFTFGSFPVTPSSSPTTEYQVANKNYVDYVTYRDNSYGVVKAASANPRNAHDAEATSTSATYTLVKTITFPMGLIGGYRVTFDMKTSDSVGPTTAYAKIYKNGVAVGTEQTDVTGGYVNKSEDFFSTLNPGDTLELWVHIDGTETVSVQNLKICYDDNPSVSVAQVNS
jgi:hypothetical protein